MRVRSITLSLVATMALVALGGVAQSKPSYGGGFAGVPDATVPPYSASGVLLVNFPGNREGHCTATAIDSSSRRLVLTAAHCLYEIPPGARRPLVARRVTFIPAYDRRRWPFGAFSSRTWRIARGWRRDPDNESFDVAAIRMDPNKRGENVADVVGGGVKIAFDQPRRQRYRLLGYPGANQQRMHQCEARYFGDYKLLRSPFGRPFGVGCFMGDGASGGPFLIEGGTTIAGVVSFSHGAATTHTFSPYFSKRLLGPVIRGY